MFTKLYEMAQELNRLQDTEYAELHPEKWDQFENHINNAYDTGEITGKQFNDLVLTAFYDWFGEFKEEE